MSRQIRRVPPHWVHPQDGNGYLPMKDKTFKQACAEWIAGFESWNRGERPHYFEADNWPVDMQYWEYHTNPPDRRVYRTYEDSEASWYQLYEEVTEGTPVTPPFETLEELANYLAEHGDFWDQIRHKEGRLNAPPGWGRERAEAFVREGWAPSLAIEVTDEGKRVIPPRDYAYEKEIYDGQRQTYNSRRGS